MQCRAKLLKWTLIRAFSGLLLATGVLFAAGTDDTVYSTCFGSAKADAVIDMFVRPVMNNLPGGVDVARFKIECDQQFALRNINSLLIILSNYTDMKAQLVSGKVKTLGGKAVPQYDLSFLQGDSTCVQQESKPDCIERLEREALETKVYVRKQLLANNKLRAELLVTDSSEKLALSKTNTSEAQNRSVLNDLFADRQAMEKNGTSIDPKLLDKSQIQSGQQFAESRAEGFTGTDLATVQNEEQKRVLGLKGDGPGSIEVQDSSVVDKKLSATFNKETTEKLLAGYRADAARLVQALDLAKVAKKKMSDKQGVGFIAFSAVIDSLDAETKKQGGSLKLGLGVVGDEGVHVESPPIQQLPLKDRVPTGAPVPKRKLMNDDIIETLKDIDPSVTN